VNLLNLINVIHVLFTDSFNKFNIVIELYCSLIQLMLYYYSIPSITQSIESFIIKVHSTSPIYL